jgi:hypothetical protein
MYRIRDGILYALPVMWRQAGLCEATAATRENVVLLWRNVSRIEFLSDWLADPTFADPHTACVYIVTRVLKCALSINASFRETGVEVILSEF